MKKLNFHFPINFSDITKIANKKFGKGNWHIEKWPLSNELRIVTDGTCGDEEIE